MPSMPVRSHVPKTTLSNHPCKSAALGVFATALLAASAGVQAHIFCVATATQLQNALTDSSDGGMYVGEVNRIKVVKGTYKTGAATNNGPFHYSNLSGTGYFDLQGGWNPGCTIRTQKAALTVLDGNNATRVLHLRQAANELDVTSFTIQNGETNSVGAGLAINDFVGDNSLLVVTGNIIRNNHTTDFAGGIYASSGTNDLDIEGNLIVNNSADSGDGAGRILTTIGSFQHNTVTRNSTTSAGTSGLNFYSSNAGYLYYNIFWNNMSTGVHLASSSVRFDYNDSATPGGFNPLTAFGDVSVDPSFVDASGGNFHLTADSPLLGAMPLDGQYPIVDPDGNSSPQYGKSDVGAFNETVFKDGFDGG